MIVCLLFHRINGGAYSNSAERFRDTLRFIAGNYNIVVPGEETAKGKLNVCITFDDAYYDFYYYVFPLLKEFNAKALLAVPVKYILDETSVEDSIRLRADESRAMSDDVYQEKAPFCTWREIREMSASGRVVAASHSYSHRPLTVCGEADLNLEINGSKEILEKKLNTDVKTFVYPYGSFDKKVHGLVRNQYDYAMRIGNAVNLDWNNYHGLIYRINSDNLGDMIEPFLKRRFPGYALKFLSNTLRGR